MIRNRSAGIVIKDGKLLVMHRVKNGEEYWVFPGGGIEEGETPEQTVVREIDEETTVKVTPIKFLYHIKWNTGQEHFFYLCDYISGEPKLRDDSNEYKRNKSGEQVYEPLWIEIDKLSNLKLYQLEIRDLFLEDYIKGFADTTKELHVKAKM